MLQACHHRLHPEEKHEPFAFEWPTPHELEKIQRIRTGQRRWKQANAARIVEKSRGWSRESKRKASRVWAAKHPDKHKRRNDRWKKSENAQRASERKIEAASAGAMKQARAAGRTLARNLSTLSLRQIEHPTYVVKGLGKPRIEREPMNDEADRFISEAEALASLLRADLGAPQIPHEQKDSVASPRAKPREQKDVNSVAPRMPKPCEQNDVLP
jgi:hypothetical protein